MGIVDSVSDYGLQLNIHIRVKGICSFAVDWSREVHTENQCSTLEC